MKTLPEIVLAHGEDKEGTDYPWWAIVKNAGFGHTTVLNGPFFDWKSAADYLKDHRYFYGNSARVRCFSGGSSQQYRELYHLAKREAAIEAARYELVEEGE